MRIAFQILERVYPKALAEWRDYVIAKVRVTVCPSKPHMVKQEYTFKGALPSCAPYFIFEAKEGVFIKYDPKSHEPVIMCAKGTLWSYRRHLTVQGLVYMLTQEFPLAAQRSLNTASADGTDAQLTQFTHTRALAEIRRMVQYDGLDYDAQGKIDETSLQTLSIFQHAVARSCDYFRLDYMEPLRVIYDRSTMKQQQQQQRSSAYESDQMRRIQTLPPAKLMALHEMARASPWLLCLRRFCHQRFGLKPLALVNMLRTAARYHVTIPPRIGVAMRLLEHIRTRLYRQYGHTLFYANVVYGSYLDAHEDNARDRSQLQSAVLWLIQNGGLTWIRVPDIGNTNLTREYRFGALAFTQTKQHVEHICRTLQSVYKRAHEQQQYPDRRHNECLVKIPPVPTEEQAAALRHFWNNWLTMVVGPPGRGKTAVIEGVFAEVYGICNITYVGTMVASQRERLGGRTECSRTAHSFYHTIDAMPQEARDVYVKQVDTLVWDEFSNVDEPLMANVLQCFHNPCSRLCRLVLIFDIHQINPINPSCCAKDMIQAFPGHVRELTVNLRVDPVYRALADIALHVLRSEIDAIEFGHDMLQDDSAVILIDPPSISFTRDMNGNETADITQTTGYALVCEAMRYFRIRKDIVDPMNFKFITPTRRFRKHINACVEHVLFHEGWMHNDVTQRRVDIRRNFDIYPGAIIAISGASFKPCAPEEVGNRYHTDEIRNGEILRIVRVTAYEDPRNRYYGGYYVACETRSGHAKYMIIHKDVHVDPIYIIRGHCVTIDASQGSEWDVTCVVFPERVAEDHHWIGVERLYVASSRARCGMLMMIPGGRATMQAVCQRKCAKRHSALAYALANDTRMFPLRTVITSNHYPEDYRTLAFETPQQRATLRVLADRQQSAVPRLRRPPK